jgi:flagellar protein FliL
LAKDKEKTTDAGGGAKPSLMSVLLPVLLLTLIAAGGGFAVGTLLAAAPNLASAGMGTEVVAEAHVAGPADKTGANGHDGSGHAAGGGIVRQLAPIITNLSSPKDIWIRIEASIIISPEAQAEQDTIAVKSSDQILALLRTVTLAQIEGPSGFLHFREDINDLVRENSEHKVSQVLISSMVVE